MEFCGDYGIRFNMERQITSFPKTLYEENEDGFNIIIAASLRRNIAIIKYFTALQRYNFYEFSVPDSNYFI